MVAYLSSRKGVFTDHKDRGLSPEILFRSMVGNSAGRDFSRTITVSNLLIIRKQPLSNVYAVCVRSNYS